MTQLSQPISKLISAYWQRRPQDSYGKDEPKIKVNVIISRLAFIYEKTRNAIDYKDEHLLRKNAIERMLKRRLYTEERRTDLGRLLLTELIRARYLPNNAIPERVIGEVDTIINKYLILLDTVAPNRLTKQRKQYSNWILSVLSSEIEHHLVSPLQEDALVEAMYQVIRQDVDLAEDISDPEERDLQVYIAIHRSLIKSDYAIIRYHLFNFFVPGWRSGNPVAIQEVQEKFDLLYQHVEHNVAHQYADRLLRFMKRFSILFTILRDVIEENPKTFESLVANPEDLEEHIRTACASRVKKAHQRLRRSFVRTIIYIFFTKMLLALLLELPYDLWVISTTHYLPLIVNVVFHPFLMLLIAISIRVPSKKNTEKIVELLKKIISQEPEPGFLYRRRKSFRRSRAIEMFFNGVYTLTFMVSFGILIWMLNALEFNIVSGLLFVFFLTVISFFGVKLRREVKELVVIDEKDNLLGMIVDFFSIPILRVGAWVSERTPKINLFIFVLDFIIEAPFKIFIEVVEDWVSFQREKKEEIY